MQYLPHTHIICLEYDEFVREEICKARGTYDSLKARGQIKVHGRGCKGSGILIEFDSLPRDYQELVYRVYGTDLHEYIGMQPILKLVRPDMVARQWYADYTKNGTTLSLELQQRYSRQCDWLNMLGGLLEDRRMLKEVLKVSVTKVWENVIALHQLDKPVNPKLPVAYDTLRKKLALYQAEGYAALVTGKIGNQNTRKVSEKIEQLIVSLYCMDHKPYLNEVCRKYREFMDGRLQVVDMMSGEVFEPKEFYVKSKVEGENKMVPYAVAESTVDYYIKKPANIQAIDYSRMNKLQWRSKYHPAVQRLSPVFAFSKITMDDRDLSFKDVMNIRSVKAYEIADVASGAIIGKAFSRDKNVELLRAALRDMMQLILCNGWGMPMEIEMEKHLTRNLQGGWQGQEAGADGNMQDTGTLSTKKNDDTDTWVDDILTEGVVFGNVRVCLGGNAREKRMEHVFRRKKYEFDNKRPGFQGRFYARMVTNRINSDNDKVRYHYEQIVQNELDDIEAYNNSLHPNQELYPNMTRWDVLEQCQNPQATVYPAHVIMPYIGYKVETSVRAGYVQVMSTSFRFPDINILTKLVRPEVDAYYIPGEKGIERIYIYQGGKFISEGIKVVPFQEAKAEQTPADIENAQRQWGYQKSFDSLVKETRARISKVGTSKEQSSSWQAAEVVGIEESGETERRAAVKKKQKALPVQAEMSARERALMDI